MLDTYWRPCAPVDQHTGVQQSVVENPGYVPKNNFDEKNIVTGNRRSARNRRYKFHRRVRRKIYGIQQVEERLSCHPVSATLGCGTAQKDFGGQ